MVHMFPLECVKLGFLDGTVRVKHHSVETCLDLRVYPIPVAMANTTATITIPHPAQGCQNFTATANGPLWAIMGYYGPLWATMGIHDNV